MDEAKVIGALVVAIYGLVELTKFIVARKESPETRGGFSRADRTDLSQLLSAVRRVETLTDKTWTAHDRYDEGGTFLWYVPREWGDTQKEILHEMRETNKKLTEVVSELRELGGLQARRPQ